MKKNTRVVFQFLIGAILFLALIFVGWDLLLRRSKTIDCEDGPRRTIDIRDFVARYSAYSLELEGSVANKAKFSGKLNPVRLQELSDALQRANEFRKFLVAGYNACAISKQQYGRFGANFEAMDSLSRRIDGIISKPDLSQPDKENLAQLVQQYVELSQGLGAE